MLKIENLHIKYGAIHAVKGIDIEVNEGEIVTLIGANGAGKTSILKALSGLVKPSEGTITYDGKVLNKKSAQDIMKAGISHVPEGRRIFADMTVLENLELGAYQRKDKEGIKKDLEAIYERFPILKDRSKQAAGTLSGGEQQRVGIVRAIIGKPEILLMDEPFSALDPISRRQLQDLIKTLHHELGLTIVFVTHNMEEAAYLGDRLCIMNHGEIIQTGTPDEIKSRPENDFVARFFSRGCDGFE